MSDFRVFVQAGTRTPVEVGTWPDDGSLPPKTWEHDGHTYTWATTDQRKAHMTLSYWRRG